MLIQQDTHLPITSQHARMPTLAGVEEVVEAEQPVLALQVGSETNELEHYDGYCRIVASDRLDPLQYQTFIEEKIEN
ncbi:MAG: hypothetical protein E6J04_14550 [Chloroflexi bacterium]|nr:MAG: hypothetical protein E6J04_14550 [Chloroflexota bacterium]